MTRLCAALRTLAEGGRGAAARLPSILRPVSGRGMRFAAPVRHDGVRRLRSREAPRGQQRAPERARRGDAEEATTQTGLIQVYTGDGKGKTTAALGLALRACGHGLRVYVGQFMKGPDSGEIASAARLATHLTIEAYGLPDRLTPQDLGPADHAAAQDGLAKADRALADGRYDLVILDEIHVALQCGLLDEFDVLDLIDRKPPTVELVLTGRDAPASIVARADLVSEMRAIRHPYDRGTPARRGIEF